MSPRTARGALGALVLALGCSSLSPAPDPAPAPEARPTASAPTPVTAVIVRAADDADSRRVHEELVRRLRGRGLLVTTEARTRRVLARRGLEASELEPLEPWLRAFAADAVLVLPATRRSVNVEIDGGIRCAIEARLERLDLRGARRLAPERADAEAWARADGGPPGRELAAAVAELACRAAADEVTRMLADALGWSASEDLRPEAPSVESLRVRPGPRAPAWSDLVIEARATRGLELRAAVTGAAVTARRDAPPAELAAANLEEVEPGRYAATVRLPPRARPDGRVTAEIVDRFGWRGSKTSPALVLPPDPAPPEPPLALGAERIADPPGVVLDWQPAPPLDPARPDGPSRYRVFRATALPPSFVPVDETEAPAYMDPAPARARDATPGATRYYAVATVDGAGNPSPPSDLIASRAGRDGRQSDPLLPRVAWREDPDLPPAAALGPATVRIAGAERSVLLDALRIDAATARSHDEADLGRPELLVVVLGSPGATVSLESGHDELGPLVEVEPGVYVAALLTEVHPDAALAVRMSEGSGRSIIRRVTRAP